MLSAVSLLVLGNCAITCGISREGRELLIKRNNSQFGSLRDALDSEVIKIGAEMPMYDDRYSIIDDIDYGRPVGFQRVTSADGIGFVVAYFSRDDERITLYGGADTLIGASYSVGEFMGESRFDLKWYFMDEKQMASLVEAMNAE